MNVHCFRKLHVNYTFFLYRTSYFYLNNINILQNIEESFEFSWTFLKWFIAFVEENKWSAYKNEDKKLFNNQISPKSSFFVLLVWLTHKRILHNSFSYCYGFSNTKIIYLIFQNVLFVPDVSF